MGGMQGSKVYGAAKWLAKAAVAILNTSLRAKASTINLFTLANFIRTKRDNKCGGLQVCNTNEKVC